MKHFFKKIIPKTIKSIIKSYYNYYSKKYYCPLCNYSSNTLEPMGADFPVITEKQIIGAGKRKAGCCNCGSSDRERLVFVFLKDYLNVFNPSKTISILHIAPETNLSKKILSYKNITYKCGDKFTEGYSYPDYVENIDVLGLPYENNQFDLIICNHVLEHIIDDTKALKELNRVLKPGGQAILQVPISKSMEKTFEDFSITSKQEREKHFGQSDHVRIYGQDYLKRLQKAEFKTQRINISSHRAYRKIGLNKAEDIFLGIK